MRVILSCGIGPLHFVSAARSIASQISWLGFVCGYVPTKDDSFALRLIGSLRGKNIAAAVKKRQINDCNFEVISCPLPEFINQAFLVIDRVLPGFYKRVEQIAWTIFGWQSRRYLHGAEVFHVRSGAGRGGAIDIARRCGMKILVDHSALHPATSAENLKADYERWGMPLAIAPSSGVWSNVLKDCEAADMIVVNANHIKESFIAHGYNKDRLRVVHLGVRKDFYGLKTDYTRNSCFRVLFTGAFVLLKGAEYVLESLRILVNRNLNISYDIVGAVNVPKRLLTQYSNMPVTYHGQLPQDQLKSFLCTADCYLFPSLADGCAQSGMEALMAGLPVVATKESGLPIRDWENGMVVPMKDAKAIADKIQYLIEHAGEAEQMGRKAARMMIANYTWDKYAENMRKIYDEMVGA